MVKKETVEFQREAGDDLPGEISDLIERGPVNNTLELIANSLDTLREMMSVSEDYEELVKKGYKPTITLNTSDDLSSMVLADNGLGMTPEQVHNCFYKLGDSRKRRMKQQEGAPPLIGQFGVGTLVLRALCESYELRTRTADIETVVSEYFPPDEGLKFSKTLERRSCKNTSGKVGTVIRMQGVRGSDDFNINNLIKNIQWKFLPLLDVFNVRIDGEKVEQQIVNGEEFVVDGYGERMRHVKGTIYLPNKSHDMAGMHLFVNGRSVGDPKSTIPLGRFKAGILNRVVGVIYADGIEDAILFDRGRFKTYHPAFKEMRKFLSDQLGEVQKAYTAISLEKKVGSLHKRKPALLNRVAGRLRTDAAYKNFRFMEVDVLPDAVPGVISGKTIRINRNYPRLRVTNRSGSAEMKEAYRQVVADIIALEVLRESGIDAYLAKKAEVLDIFTRDIPIVKRMFGSMLYSVGSIAGHLGIDRTGVSYLIKNGALSCREKDGKIVGRDVLRIEPAMRGQMTLADFIKNYFGATSMNQYEGKCKAVFGNIDNELGPIVEDIGSDGKQCYVVDKVCADGLAAMLRSPEFDLRNPNAEKAYVPAFKAYKQRFLSVPELAKTSESGLTYNDVAETIDYAGRKKIPIAEEMRGSALTYCYGDFISALQARRAGQ